MDAKSVVTAAKAMAKDLFDDEGVADIRLEEVHVVKNEEPLEWDVTLSFRRPPETVVGDAALLGFVRATRVLRLAEDAPADYRLVSVSRRDQVTF
jgi:hypothetical protein